MRKTIGRIQRVLCLALGGFVILMAFWSYRELDAFTTIYHRSEMELNSVRGEGRLAFNHSNFRRSRAFDLHWLAFNLRRDIDRRDYLRYSRSWSERRGFQLQIYNSGVTVSMPHWFAALLLLVAGFSDVIQRSLLKRLPPVPRSVRPRLLRASRLFVIAMVTAVLATPIVVLSAHFTFKEAWAALTTNPLTFGLFLVIPLAGVWLVRKPLRVQRERLMIYRDRYLCTVCGYNLTANTTGICPECGSTSKRLTRVTEPSEENESHTA